MDIADVRSKIGRRVANIILRSAGNSQLYSPPGHFYSPIVDGDEAEGYLERFALAKDEAQLPIVDPAELRATLARLSPHFAEALALLKSGRRYRESHSYFNLGEACIYAAFIRALKPRLIVEVGSGFSSACALDAVDHYGLDTSLVFIEPNPERLYQLLLPDDRARVAIYECGVQDVDLSIFDDLAENDILFLDTTHVFKTGSDVAHELFRVLPRLKSGVTIHFHDIFDGWEYPLIWVRETRSWNEIYALRAFLMYNAQFKISYFNDFVQHNMKDEIATTAISGLSDLGSGFYLRKCLTA
jgi:hypothetical protein